MIRSFSLICDPGVLDHPVEMIIICLVDCPYFEGSCAIISYLLNLCDIVVVGKKLHACWESLTTMASHNLERSSPMFFFYKVEDLLMVDHHLFIWMNLWQDNSNI